MVKYYGVHVGKIKGVFQDWNYVKSLVNGYPGAIYKSFNSYDEAEHFRRTGGTAPIANLNSGNATTIYTDGSCVDKIGGWGVVIILPTGKFVGKCGLVPYDPCTNNIAELYAIEKALEEQPENNLIIYSDSMYSINVFTKWLPGWKKNNWKRSNGEPVLNAELIDHIDKILQMRTVSFKHVKAHAGHPLNDAADRLANEGRSK